MNNKARITIDLCKNESSVSANAKIKFDYAINNEFIFYMANGFDIDEINDGKCSMEYYCIEEELEFRAQTKKIIIKSQSMKELFVSYHGRVDSWHTLYEKEILAVNFYTAWYPTGLSMNAEYMVRVHLDDSYYVINGKYDDKEKLWYYKPLDFDVNIIALRNYQLIKDNTVSLFYFGETNKQAVLPYYENYNRIINYYTELYGNMKADKTNIVILPKGNKYDGYLRKSLIVFGGIQDDYQDIVHLLAHEIAHSWCHGAETDSWEDWLNETFAEWSALLYELEINNNINKFNEIIKDKKKRLPDIMPLKTKDLSRPDGVHDNGVLHLYKLYCQSGKDAIKNILRAFDSLKVKTTDNLIKELKQNEESIMLSEYISDIIE